MNISVRSSKLNLGQISTLICLFTLSTSLASSATKDTVPVVQSLKVVAEKTDQTAVLLAKSMMTHGSFGPVPIDTKQMLLSLLDATVTRSDRDSLPRRLQLAGGFNGTGGGGGVACFKTKELADSALDESGRLKRDHLASIADFDQFDTFRVIHRDPRRWDEVLKGNFHLRKPLPGEKAESFLRRVLYQNILAFFPLLVERLMAIMVRYPFATWQGVSGTGLPFYPDVDHTLFEDLRKPQNTCIYAPLAIRTVKNSGKAAEQVQYFYDQDLLARVRELSSNDEEYQRWLATLILHEDAYLLARELGAKNADDVRKIIEMTLFDDADMNQIKAEFFQPGAPNANGIDQSIGTLFETPYRELLSSEPELSPWPSKLDLYDAWLKMIRREQELQLEQEKRGCSNHDCMAAGGLLWKSFFSHPEEAKLLTPVEAYFALSPSLSFNNDIASPEALVARSVDPRGALNYSCRRIDFDGILPHSVFTMHAADTNEVKTLDPEVGKILFSKIKAFCQPALADGVSLRSSEVLSPGPRK